MRFKEPLLLLRAGEGIYKAYSSFAKGRKHIQQQKHIFQALLLEIKIYRLRQYIENLIFKHNIYLNQRNGTIFGLFCIETKRSQQLRKLSNILKDK